MTILDKVWKILGMIWTAAAFIAAVSFFFGGQWQDWEKIRADYKSGKFGQGDMSGFVTNDALSSTLGNYVPSTQLLSQVEAAGFVKFGDPISIRDTRQPAIVVMRRGPDGGAYLSPYLDTVIDGPDTSFVWFLKKEGN